MPDFTYASLRLSSYWQRRGIRKLSYLTPGRLLARADPPARSPFLSGRSTAGPRGDSESSLRRPLPASHGSLQRQLSYRGRVSSVGVVQGPRCFHRPGRLAERCAPLQAALQPSSKLCFGAAVTQLPPKELRGWRGGT